MLHYLGKSIGRGGAGGGLPPSEKKFYDPPLAFKTTPTPLAFSPLPQISSFLS